MNLPQKGDQDQKVAMLDIPGCSPMGDRLIVLPIPEKDTMAGAIIIPEFAKNRAIMYRVKIISMGRGKYDLLGRHVPFFVKVGQQCFLNRYGVVTKVVIAGELHYVIRENDLIGIVRFMNKYRNDHRTDCLAFGFSHHATDCLDDVHH